MWLFKGHLLSGISRRVRTSFATWWITQPNGDRMERAVVFRQEQCDLQGPFEIATIMQDHRVPTLKLEPSIHTPPKPF